MRTAARRRSTAHHVLVRALAGAVAGALVGAAPTALAAQHDGHAGAGAAAPAARELGRVRFPNGGAPAAQAPFLTGVALLHNFHYDEAAAAFRRAQAADRTFAPAYWAEALSHSAVFWGYEALDTSRAVLARLGPTADARLARARTPDERALGVLVEAFYAQAPLPDRARAAADAGRRWAATARGEEPLAFAALAVMMQGYTTRGAASDTLLAEAAGYAQRLFDRSPRHPGAAHYLIHAWDRPTTAARGLAAARAYDRIAPGAEHALHMPSHIYYQLGMWAEMARSNERSWAASRARSGAQDGGRGSPHALAWLQYAYLQQGRRREAAALVDTAQRLYASAAPSVVASPDEAHSAAVLAFRYGVETGDWSAWPASVDSAGAHADLLTGDGAARPSARAVGMGVYRAYHEAAGSLLARGDTAAASAAAARFAATAESLAKGGSDADAGRIPQLRGLAEQLAGLVARQRGDTAAALAAFRRAVAVMPGGGPAIPNGIPSRELLAAVQLAAGDARGAAASYDSALAAFPNRSALLLGAARARAAAGDAAGSARAYAGLRANWSRADAGVSALGEATRGAPVARATARQP